MLKNRTAQRRLKVEVHESPTRLDVSQFEHVRPDERTPTGEVADSLDVRGLQRKLEEHIGPMPPASEPEPAAPALGPYPSRAFLVRRMGKILLGAAVVAAFGLVPLRTLLQTSSVEAVVNARLMTLRSPIAGEVIASPAELAASGALERGSTLLRIVNSRADRGRLDELEQTLGKLASQRETLNTKLAAAQAAETDLDQQAEAFRLGRIEQLAARTAELESLIGVAVARREEAAAAYRRAEALARTGNVTAAEFDRLSREVAIATGTETSTRHRLAAANVELAAARNRIFLGDSYNDRPSSVQRGDEMRQRIADLRSELAGLDAETRQLEAALATARARYQTQSDVAMTLPVTGRIWEAMVSPGEQVRVGQDLARLIDCSTAVVTANVTESVYNRLSVGSPARFIPADGGSDLQGKVVNLTGRATAAANLAIEPAVLSKEPYRVTVSVPDLGTGQVCAVGRTGRVVFGEQASTP